MPDKFVPVDTSGVSPYFVKTRPLIYRFALKYTENNRETLKKFTESGRLKNISTNRLFWTSLFSMPQQTILKWIHEGLKTSGEIINTQIKAYIARNMLDNKGFYPIWENIDTTLKYAIDFLKK